jgi:hypothetical protein
MTLIGDVLRIACFSICANRRCMARECVADLVDVLDHHGTITRCTLMPPLTILVVDQLYCTCISNIQ